LLYLHVDMTPLKQMPAYDTHTPHVDLHCVRALSFHLYPSLRPSLPLLTGERFERQTSLEIEFLEESLKCSSSPCLA